MTLSESEESELIELIAWGDAIAKRIAELTGSNAVNHYAQKGVVRLHSSCWKKIGLDDQGNGGIMIYDRIIISDSEFLKMIGKDEKPSWDEALTTFRRETGTPEPGLAEELDGLRSESVEFAINK